MLNCLFYVIFFSLFLNVSTGSLKLSQLNKTFMSPYKGLFEASVITVDNNGEPIFPFYDKDALLKSVKKYLEPNVRKITTNYVLLIKFYRDDGITETLENEPCRNVRIKLYARINTFFQYNNQKTFSIKERITNE